MRKSIISDIVSDAIPHKYHHNLHENMLSESVRLAIQESFLVEGFSSSFKKALDSINWGRVAFVAGSVGLPLIFMVMNAMGIISIPSTKGVYGALGLVGGFGAAALQGIYASRADLKKIYRLETELNKAISKRDAILMNFAIIDPKSETFEKDIRELAKRYGNELDMLTNQQKSISKDMLDAFMGMFSGNKGFPKKSDKELIRYMKDGMEGKLSMIENPTKQMGQYMGMVK